MTIESNATTSVVGDETTPDAKPAQSGPAAPRPFVGRLVRLMLRRLCDRADDYVLRRSLRLAGFRGVESIPTYTMPSELATLYNLAMWCPPGARVLEIGSYLGASTCYLGAALAHRGGTLTCVDTWQNQTMPEGERDTYGEFLRNVAPIHDRLTLVRKRAEDLTPADIPGPYDLVFLDGDHSYAATRRDFDLVRERVAGDGVVAFHDCAEWEGVSHVIGEALACGQWALVGKVDNLMWMRRANWSHASPQSRRELPSVDP